jgi:hypothetical protein
MTAAADNEHVSFFLFKFAAMLTWTYDESQIKSPGWFISIF